MIIAKAPGVVKLLGEHAVVYGRLSLACAITKYATAKVSAGKGNYVLLFPDIGEKASASKEELAELYKSFMNRQSIEEYIRLNNTKALPFLTIAAIAYAEFGVEPFKMVLSSTIPMQKGFASSAALSTAMATALLFDKCNDKEIIEVARTGEIVMHKNEGAGRIDVSTSYLGGYVTYAQREGAKKLKISTMLNLLAIDTGPKKSTAETVGHVAELYKQNKEEVEKIFDAIEKCTSRGINALQANDLKSLGQEMYKDHAYLAQLGVSSEGLDKVVELAKKAGAYGAKLSGGGGGGISIALYNKRLEQLAKEEGFSSMRVKVSLKGAKELVSEKG